MNHWLSRQRRGLRANARRYLVLRRNGRRPPELAIPGSSGGILCQNIKLFGRSRTCSIDFSQLGPMFRLNAALDRNAIPWFAARLRKSEPPAS